MGCLVLVSPTRGLGPAETSYSFQYKNPKVKNQKNNPINKLANELNRHF
jgi:hypothetical protein